MRYTSAIVATIAVAASIQVVQTYRYDANGRLVEVERSQGGATVSTAYALDDADNRVSVTRTEGSSLMAYRTGGEDVADAPLAQASHDPAGSDDVRRPDRAARASTAASVTAVRQ